MKKVIKNVAIISMLASPPVFAWDATDYNNYLSEINSEVNNFNPATFINYKNDPAFDALESKLVEIVAQMKSYWYVAQISENESSDNAVISYEIKDVDSYLLALDSSVDSANADLFKNFKQDEEFKKLESDLIIIMKAMSNYKNNV